MFKIISDPFIILLDLCSWDAFSFHAFWTLMEWPFGYCGTAVRLHCWLLTTRLSVVLSFLSLVRCVVLRFCLSVSMTVRSRSGEEVAACVRVVTLPGLDCTCTSHALWKWAWHLLVSFWSPGLKKENKELGRGQIWDAHVLTWSWWDTLSILKSREDKRGGIFLMDRVEF